MELFIGPLTGNIMGRDITNFFNGFNQRCSVQIFSRKDKYFKEAYRYAVVDIEPERLARKALKCLNMKPLDRLRVVVRAFSHRACNNERRDVSWRGKNWHSGERRNIDRRHGKVERDIEPSFEV
ncbi:MAG: hypothetical protein BMS9Abin26_0438 [Gammaproteobacteria bacterium]|nr:MAG: hypothetical protein BMS9Abin26_0438 [Gammaproteobacteria bacterium]